MRTRRSGSRCLARVLLAVLGAVIGGLVVAPMAGPHVGWAQPDPITAELDRATATTDDVVTLTVTVRSDDINPPMPEVPPFDGFEILGTGSSRQIEIVNGAVQSQAVYTYQLRPLRLGRLIIAPATVAIAGQAYASRPLALTVTAGTAPTPAPVTPDPGSAAGGPGSNRATPLLRVEASAEPARPYVGQAVVYTFRFIRSTELQLPGQPRYTAPAFTGLWNQFAPEQTRQTVQNGAAVEIVSELRTVVFPTAPGPVTIEPATLTLPGGFARRSTEVKTESVTLDVRPLPAGAPTGFAGAVGRYRVDASLDRAQGVVDEPFTLTVTVGGDGNIDALPEPAWPAPPAGWRVLDGKSTAHSEARGGRVSGARRFERLLIPSQAGAAELPAIPLVFFDPATGRYETVASQPLRVMVAPGAGASGAESATAGAAAGSGIPGGTVAGAALRGDKPLAAIAATGTVDRTLPWPWVWAWLLPAVAVLANRAWPGLRSAWRGRRPAPDAALARSRGLLARARRHSLEAPALVAEALTTYAAHKLGQRPDGLTRAGLATRLGAAGVDPAWIGRVDACLGACDAERFGRAAMAGATDAHSHASQPLVPLPAAVDPVAPKTAVDAGAVRAFTPVIDEAEAVLAGLAASAER